MYILSADTTAKVASVCLSKMQDNNSLGILSSAFVGDTLTHSESLLPMIDFCLKKANILLSDVSVLATTVGPGSFTGVRIGSSTFKGIAFANDNIKCIGVSTIESLAYNLSGLTGNAVVLPLMDARRNQFYNAFFSYTRKGNLKRHTQDALSTFDEIIEIINSDYADKKIVLVGDGANLFHTLCKKKEVNTLKITLCDVAYMYENAFSVAKAAVKLYESAKDKSIFTAEALNPLYLRASQAERERNEKLLQRG